jgi:hypothetical protein
MQQIFVEKREKKTGRGRETKVKRWRRRKRRAKKMRGEGGSKERKLLNALLSLVSMRGRLRGRVKCGRSEGEWRGGEAAGVGEEKAELQAGQLE